MILCLPLLRITLIPGFGNSSGFREDRLDKHESLLDPSVRPELLTETALRDNTKIVIAEHGVSPTLLMGNLPVSIAPESKGKVR